MDKQPTGRKWPYYLQFVGLGLGLGLGLTAGREWGDSLLTRILIGALVSVAVVLAWYGVVWLLFLRGRT